MKTRRVKLLVVDKLSDILGSKGIDKSPLVGLDLSIQTEQIVNRLLG